MVRAYGDEARGTGVGGGRGEETVIKRTLLRGKEDRKNKHALNRVMTEDAYYSSILLGGGLGDP